MALSKDLLFLIRQFCDEEKLPKTVHMLEEETGFHFDMDYFEGLVMNGNWDGAEKYLSGFTLVEANEYSIKMYFEMRKQKFFEALDKNDVAMALEILLKDLKFFAPSNEELYKEMSSLLTMDDFRRHHSLSSYGDVISARRRVMDEIKLLIAANPHFCRKMELPEIGNSRLRRLINQSLNWQHIQCTHFESQPEIQTLFFDHKCPGQRNQHNRLSFQAITASLSPFLENSIVQPPTVLESGSYASAFNPGNRNSSSVMLEGVKDSHNISGISSRMSLDKNVNSISPEDFPKNVERCLNMNSCPSSMDFHPVKETLLLVGNITGEIELWEITSEVKLFWTAFAVWKREAMTVSFLNDLDKDPQMSVRRVLWSPYGSLFGVAYSKHVVQLYSYHVMTNYIEKHFEIDAHSGSVNDLAFSSPCDQLLLITCGDDKFIQVWDTLNGSKQYTFGGHCSPVYSLCPHVKEDINFLFSTSTSGEIKAWLFDETGPRVEYEAPGHSCVRLAYSDDGKRLFSCGTNTDGDSYLVEWNDTEGYMTRTYHGLCKASPGIVQFSTSKNRFLVAGDEHLLKVWDMDNVELLTIVGGDECLPAKPYMCFNKEGSLLAVFAENGKIKVLANDAGTKLLQNSTFSSVGSTGYLSKSLQKEIHMRPQVPLELNRLLNTKSCSKIFQIWRCRSLRLPSEVKTNQICRLVYTNSGNGILALAADGIHLIWKWPGNEYNSFGNAITNHVPHLWQPRSALPMINELTDDPFQLVSHCFAISKNDSYVVSSSGKMVCLFNILTFERMRSCLMSPPAATCMAFYPSDNNVVAIGMDDSTILIYNIRITEPTNRLCGHSKRISGLAFSNMLKVLVSAAVDTQIILWDANVWQQKKSISLPMNPGWLPSETSETTVQFHRDQRHFLAVHETQLAIYAARNLECVNRWTSGNFCARISHGTFSCDNQLVYAVMRDGIVMIFSFSDLSPRFLIDPSVYLPPNIGCVVYPVVVAAHPKKVNQIALGLSNGGVIVVEPHESDGKWSVPLPLPPQTVVGNRLRSNRIIID